MKTASRPVLSRDRSTMDAAKAKLTIPELWKLRRWAGEPGLECVRPYSPEDRRKSGSVFADGLRFHDFKTGETMDAPALLAMVENLSIAEACKLFIGLAGGNGPALAQSSPIRRPVATRRCSHANERVKPSLPSMRMPEGEEISVVAAQRSLPWLGVKLAGDVGALRVARYAGLVCWCVCDSSGWNVQFRRMDGEPFVHNGVAKKTLGVKGGWGSWPIGACDIGKAESVMLVEGSGDYLAAWAAIDEEEVSGRVAAVCVTGAGVWLPRPALTMLSGRTVRIFPHLDTSGAGQHGALRWEAQLTAAGARAHCFDLAGLVTPDGCPVEDLNDAMRMAKAARRALGFARF